MRFDTRPLPVFSQNKPARILSPPNQHVGKRITWRYLGADPSIEVVMFSGRSLEAKRALYKALVTNLSVLGVPATEIKIVLLEVPAENWGLRGGCPASEIDLGLKVTWRARCR
ncbi:tautomerase family protein [Bradyrhizobium sp. SSUT18]|uniref:tautomerase family protein n=1 Tax=Bradyrhizobium sp. SSUT18 TaxID=3040602 RepID=UPI00244BC93B|nr:tautomerase family protein [Bradyrhizobium sp. SSUT18]MDH2400143.1 tautomerase family protein [Bradyrhizobium sp. SSUT18]